MKQIRYESCWDCKYSFMVWLFSCLSDFDSKMNYTNCSLVSLKQTNKKPWAPFSSHLPTKPCELVTLADNFRIANNTQMNEHRIGFWLL